MNKLTLEFTKEVGKLLENWKEIMELYSFFSLRKTWPYIKLSIFFLSSELQGVPTSFSENLKTAKYYNFDFFKRELKLLALLHL